MISIAKEVEATFKENPNVVNMTLHELAIFFMVQGELRYSLLRETLQNKSNYFAMRLKEADKEAYAKAKEEWDKAASGPSSIDKIGSL